MQSLSLSLGLVVSQLTHCLVVSLSLTSRHHTHTLSHLLSISHSLSASYSLVLGLSFTLVVSYTHSRCLLSFLTLTNGTSNTDSFSHSLTHFVVSVLQSLVVSVSSLLSLSDLTVYCRLCLIHSLSLSQYAWRLALSIVLAHTRVNRGTLSLVLALSLTRLRPMMA